MGQEEFKAPSLPAQLPAHPCPAPCPSILCQTSTGDLKQSPQCGQMTRGFLWGSQYLLVAGSFITRTRLWEKV